MARIKRTSGVLEKASARATALGSIDKQLNLGNDLTLDGYNKQIKSLNGLLSDYNQILSKVDSIANELIAAEEQVKDWSERMLAGVAAKFGKDSNEYEMAGGVKKSERKIHRKSAQSTNQLSAQ